MIRYGLPIALLWHAIVFLYGWSPWFFSRGWARCRLHGCTDFARAPLLAPPPKRVPRIRPRSPASTLGTLALSAH
jgi:hypothetical protein